MTPDVPAVLAIAARHAAEPGGLMPALHAVQDACGYVPKEAVPGIAELFNLSRAEVHGVITYYHHFRSEPAGRCVVQVCQAESCQAMGAVALYAHAKRRLGCGGHGTSSDGAFTLEPVYCLGLCASSPAMVVGDDVHARVTVEKFDRVIAEVGAMA
jgi:formate dehydrogenase subunit gamma